ncbi:acyl carrier protein [Lysobacter sp. A378]
MNEESCVEVTESRVRQFVHLSFPSALPGEEYSSTQSLIETGVMDSMGVLVMVTWLEEEFGIVVDDEDVIPDNLDSIANLGNYVDRKLAEMSLAG